MKLKSFLSAALLPLALSGCFDETPFGMVNRQGLNGIAPHFLAAESHEFKVKVEEPSIASYHDKLTSKCRELKCEVLQSSVLNDDMGTKARLLAMLPEKELDYFIAAINSTPAKLDKHLANKNGMTSAAEVEKRIAIKEAARDSLLKELQNNTGTFRALAAERELMRLQTEIEAAKSARPALVVEEVEVTETEPPPPVTEGEKAQSEGTTSLVGSVKKTMKKIARPQRMIMVDVDISQPAGLGGIDFALVKKAISRATPLASQSTAAMIVFAAIALPWLPVAIIVMWLLAIVFKSKVKIQTVNAATGKNSPPPPPVYVAPAPIPQAAPAAEAKPKKGFLGGFMKKKEPEPDLEEEESPLEE